MFLHRRFIPGLAIYSYLVGDEKTREAAVIDPTRDVDEYLRIARAEGLRIAHVVETHVHADFLSGARELKARLGGEPRIHCSGLGGPEWTPGYADEVAADGHEIRMGSVRLRAVHTPGHTYEHVSWALFDETRSRETPWVLFSGDFLFVGDVGRPDLLGEEARAKLAHQLYDSVFRRLPPFEDFLEIFPAHGAGSLCGKALGSRASTTLGFERRFASALRERPEAEWIAALLEGMPIAPPYFRRMKKLNAAGPELIGPELPGSRRFDAREVRERVCEHCTILDTRSKEAFAAGHVPGAINIPLGPSFATWAGWVLPYDSPILVVLDDPRDMHEVATHLIRIGLDDLRGSLEGGIDAWETGGNELGRLETMSVHGLASRLKKGAASPTGSGPFVLDVRTDGEWESGHVEGATHVHGGLLSERIGEIPRDRPVAVICGSGYRASIASSFLLRHGFTEVANVLGGMAAWKAAGLPVAR